MYEAGQIFHGVKLTLTGKAKARASVEGSKRSPFKKLDISQACPVSGSQLLLQRSGRFFRWKKQKPIKPFKVAVDLFFVDDALDLVYRRSVTLGREARSVFSVNLLQLEITVVQGICKMGGRT
jgi:hypothetical protein